MNEEQDISTPAQSNKHRKRWPELSPEQIEIAPYGQKTCRLCQLPPPDLKLLNVLRFEQGMTYRKMREYMKEKYEISPDFTELTKHFKKHVGDMVGGKVVALETTEKYPEIIEILHPMEQELAVKTNQDIEKAYGKLVQMTTMFTKNLERLTNIIDEIIREKDIKTEIKGLSAIELLERLAKLNKEARDQVKDVSSLRAPKVMVAQILEAFINNVIGETSVILTNTCGEIQYAIQEELKDSSAMANVSDKIFQRLFRKAALDYRDRMLGIKRTQLAEAMTALNEMEKII